MSEGLCNVEKNPQKTIYCSYNIFNIWTFLYNYRMYCCSNFYRKCHGSFNVTYKANSPLAKPRPIMYIDQSQHSQERAPTEVRHFFTALHWLSTQASHIFGLGKVMPVFSLENWLFLKGTYHAKFTFFSPKCILLYIWSLYKYRKVEIILFRCFVYIFIFCFGHILQPVPIFLFSMYPLIM